MKKVVQNGFAKKIRALQKGSTQTRLDCQNLREKITRKQSRKQNCMQVMKTKNII